MISLVVADQRADADLPQVAQRLRIEAVRRPVHGVVEHTANLRQARDLHVWQGHLRMRHRSAGRYQTEQSDRDEMPAPHATTLAQGLAVETIVRSQGRKWQRRTSRLMETHESTGCSAS